MKKYLVKSLCILTVAVVASITVVGCGKKSGSPGVMEKTGAAIDTALDKTGEAAKQATADAKEAMGYGKEPGAMEKTGAAVDTALDKTSEAARQAAADAKEATGKALEKTGEAVEKAGASMEKAGADMQK